MVAAALIVAVTSSASGATLTPVPLRADPTRNERMSAADGPWITWSQTVRGTDATYNVFAQKGSEPKIKVSRHNSAAEDGFTLGVPLGGGIDGHRVIYTELNSEKYDISVYNLVTHQRTRLPTKVNHPDTYELHPTLSGKCSSSPATSPVRTKVLLHNIKSHAMRVLAETRWESLWWVEAGQVNGRYATWSRYGGRHNESNVYVYNIRTKLTKIMREG